MAFNGCCPDCKVPGDDCPLVWGQCSHCFHMHCILKWLNSQQVQQHCPMCRQEWKFKEVCAAPIHLGERAAGQGAATAGSALPGPRQKHLVQTCQEANC
ncbi:anaphase-promoting complex subunit 11 [Alligator mississippiensis]|uniref:Anaphase-promoting complex subunit 11 n=1 Tax=Alligator mississippiensis TaxID=8496 RepID=A0A151NRA8_ALLMI|nr:anaphase-promoting complex subunit 11 [Alligator mississippiensis]